MLTFHHEDRDRFIEIWRGISVFIVVYFHLAARVPPEALGVAEQPLIVNTIGKLGVFIFFVISAFLIARSLEGCAGLGEFYAKRISRIWPLFALASVTVYLFGFLLPPPVHHAEVDNFNTEPRRLIDLFGTIFFLRDLGFRLVDGAYWSIIAELKFYFLVGAAAAIFGTRYTGIFCTLAFAISGFGLLVNLVLKSGIAAQLPDIAGILLPLISKALNGFLIAKYLHFFALGLALYRGKLDALFCALVFLCAVATIVELADDGFTVMPNAVFLLLFSCALALDHFLLNGSAFFWIGRYSYSIYLFHQMIGLGLMKALAPQLGIDLALMLALGFVIALAWLGSWMCEWRFRRSVAAWLLAIFGSLGLNRLAVAGPAEGATAPHPVNA
jgi:peptidoglycan/LPS O-acetylase OafA/YrhL